MLGSLPPSQTVSQISICVPQEAPSGPSKSQKKKQKKKAAAEKKLIAATENGKTPGTGDKPVAVFHSVALQTVLLLRCKCQ